MRILLTTIPMALLLLASVAFGSDPSQYVVDVKGMTWGGSCAKAVRATLNKLDNVDQVKVDFQKKKAFITMKKGTLTRADVAAVFKGGRYSVAGFESEAKHSKKYTLNISGMTWGAGCAKRVRGALSKLDNVKDVKVDLSKKTAEVVMKAGASLKKETAAAVLKRNGGYGITGFKEQKPKPNTVAISVSGMTWGSCESRVRAALSKVDGVKNISIDFRNKIATLTFKDNAKITEETLSAAFKGSRYKITSFDWKREKAIKR